MKKFIRNIISILALTFLFCGIGTTSFAEDINKELSVLTKLGIIKDTFSTEGEMTRGEFAELVYKALKLQKLDVTYFSDLPRNHNAASAVSALVERNIISLSPEGKFNPEEKITYEQACKILVCATGYNSFVNYSEFGMKAYTMAAADMGFAISAESTKPLTKGEAIKLLFDAMTVNITVNQNGVITIDEDETLFSRYHNVYYDEGQLKGLYGFSLDDFNFKKNEICIDNEIMQKADNLDLEDLFCDEIGYIYIDEKDDKSVIFAESTGRSESIKIESSAVESFDSESFTLKYYEGIKEKKASIKKDSVICVNGRVYTKPLSDEIKKFINGERKGTIKLISSKGSSDYDIVIIKSYEVFVIGAYDSGNEMYYDYYETSKTFSPEDYKNIRIVDKNGRETTIPTTYPAPVLILKSEDKSFVEIIRFDEKININITAINDEEKILTDLGEYSIDKNIYPYVKTTICVGGKYSVFADIYNEIIYISDITGNGKNIGYIRQTLVNEDDIQSPLSFKIYSIDGTTAVYKSAKRIKIDNENYNSTDLKKIAMAFPGESDIDADTGKLTLEKQVILFETNTEGEIVSVDTKNISEKEVKEKSLRLTDAGTYYYTAAVGKFGATLLVNANTKYIVVPSIGIDGTVIVDGMKISESDNMYANKYVPQDWQAYDVEGYKFNDNSMATDLIVVKIQPKKPRYMSYMFDSIIKTVGEDGEVCDTIVGYAKGEKVTFVLGETATEAAKSLQKGDIFMVEIDFTGEKVMSITKQFNVNTLAFEKNGNYTDSKRAYWSGAVPTPGSYGGIGGWRDNLWQLINGYAYDIKGGAMGICYTLADADEDVLNEVFSVSSLKVTVFDKKKEREPIYTGTLNDIVTYKNAGENCDRIILGSSGSGTNQIFVYKN